MSRKRFKDYEQGRSLAYTEIKQERLRYTVKLIASYHRATVARHRWIDPVFYVFDITAGSGVNILSDGRTISGSPLIIHSVLSEMGINFKCFFMDLNSDSCVALADLFKHDSRVTVECGDHNVLLPYYADLIKPTRKTSCAGGIVYVDLNGKVPPFPVDAFASFFAKTSYFRYADAIIDVAATPIKRNRRCRSSLANYMAQVPKKRWLIYEPVAKHQWSLMIATNSTINDWPGQTIYDISRKAGEKVLNRLNFTAKERKAGMAMAIQSHLPFFEQSFTGAHT